MIVVLFAVLALAITEQPQALQDRGRALLDEAIVAAGGLENLERYPVLAWHGRATIHAGGRDIRIEGLWIINPPDRARVETYEVDQGAQSLRTMIIDGERGWSRIGGNEQPLPPDLVANERDQFYLYYLLRLAPLRGAAFRLTPLDPDAEGNAGLRVRHDGRRDADLYFNRSLRVVRIVTSITDPASGRGVAEELRLKGVLESAGIRWPARIEMLQDGVPFFDLELTDLTAHAELPNPR